MPRTLSSRPPAGRVPAVTIRRRPGPYPGPVIDGWHWAAAVLAAVLLGVLVLLWYDSLRDRPGWSLSRATKRALLATPVIPVGFVAALLLPLWVGGILIVAPLVIILVMAMAD
jgi:hypothetical protein